MHLRILADALAGLHPHAHELLDFDGTPLNIVHRDVSPHNVMVTYDGFVKSARFSGIAKAADSSSDTRSGMLAEEQVRLHGAGAVQRRPRRSSRGPLRHGRDALASHHRPAHVEGHHRHRDHRARHQGRHQATQRARSRRRPEARGHLHEGARSTTRTRGTRRARNFQSAIEDHLRSRSILVSSARGRPVRRRDLAVESRSRIRSGGGESARQDVGGDVDGDQSSWLTAPEASRSGEVPPHTTTSSVPNHPGSAAPTESFQPSRRSQRMLLGAAGLVVLWVLCFAGIAFWPSRTTPAPAPAAPPSVAVLPVAIPAPPPTSAPSEDGAPGSGTSAAASPSAAASVPVVGTQPALAAQGRGYYRVVPRTSATTPMVPPASSRHDLAPERQEPVLSRRDRGQGVGASIDRTHVHPHKIREVPFGFIASFVRTRRHPRSARRSFGGEGAAPRRTERHRGGALSRREAAAGVGRRRRSLSEVPGQPEDRSGAGDAPLPGDMPRATGPHRHGLVGVRLPLRRGPIVRISPSEAIWRASTWPPWRRASGG